MILRVVICIRFSPWDLGGTIFVLCSLFGRLPCIDCIESMYADWKAIFKERGCRRLGAVGRDTSPSPHRCFYLSGRWMGRTWVTWVRDKADEAVWTPCKSFACFRNGLQLQPQLILVFHDKARYRQRS